MFSVAADQISPIAAIAAQTASHPPLRLRAIRTLPLLQTGILLNRQGYPHGPPGRATENHTGTAAKTPEKGGGFSRATGYR
jgi:hypothetical protein